MFNDQNKENTNCNWERSTLEKLLFEVYKNQRSIIRGKRIRNIVFIFIFIMAIYFLINNSFFNVKKLNYNGNSYTALITLDTAIDKSLNIDEKIIKSLNEAYKDKNVKGIIIKANSPGGSPVISANIYDEIIQLKKQNTKIPIYVVIEDICASGCYYIASAADKIFANPSSLVGSIGVISYSFGLDKFIARYQIENRIKTSGRNKSMGDIFSSETTEQKQIWTILLKNIHNQFIEAVKKGRDQRLKWTDDDQIFSGRIYSGIEGKKNGLIDDFGNFYQVAREVIKAPEIVDFTIENNVLNIITKKVGASFSSDIKEKLNNILLY